MMLKFFKRLFLYKTNKALIDLKLIALIDLKLIVKWTCTMYKGGESTEGGYTLTQTSEDITIFMHLINIAFTVSIKLIGLYQFIIKVALELSKISRKILI